MSRATWYAVGCGGTSSAVASLLADTWLDGWAVVVGILAGLAVMVLSALLMDRAARAAEWDAPVDPTVEEDWWSG